MPDRNPRDEKQVETAEKRCPKKPANAGSLNCSFWVLSFLQVLILYICYVFKNSLKFSQPVAAYRSGSCKKSRSIQ